MASKPPVAVYDACVLYPIHLRNVLIQCAVDGLVVARWTDEIHDEWIRNLTANAPEIAAARLETTRDRMKAVLPEANVTNYKALIPALSLPDPNDRHVLAAAVAGNAEVIITWNLKDFPGPYIASYGINVASPDDFLTELHAAFPKALISSMVRARQNLRKTMPTVEQFIGALERQGLASFASILRQSKAFR